MYVGKHDMMEIMQTKLFLPEVLSRKERTQSAEDAVFLLRISEELLWNQPSALDMIWDKRRISPKQYANLFTGQNALE